MIRVAIAGNIASGKSLVQTYLEEEGYKVLDSDIVAHSLLVDNEDVKQIFGNYDILDADGLISRKKLGKVVFSNDMLRIRLEKVLHPKIKECIQRYFIQNSDDEILFVGIPLLFEANMTSLFDKIIFVSADDKIRLERLMNRNNYTEEHAQRRMACQQSQEEKIKKSDYVIENNSTKEELKKKVMEILTQLSGLR